MYLSEFRKGYKRKDGVKVADKYYQWRVIFKQSFVKYISEHFANGLMVEIKGDASPFAVVQGKEVEGYSVLGQTINIFGYPSASQMLEKKIIEQSQETSSGVPDVAAYNEPDF